MKHPLFLIAAAMIVACSPQKNASAQQPAAQWSKTTLKKEDANALLRFETGGCRGYCPIYKLTFRNDGSMEYFGNRHVEKVGNQTIKLTADEFSQLQNAVRRANLWEQPERLPSQVADAPPHTFTVFNTEKKHSVRAMGPMPQPMQELENLVQNIAEAHGIMVKKGVDPNDPASMKGQVIVKFKPDVNAGNFCMQFMEFKTKPVRRLGEDNIWLIGYNPSELTEEQFINIISGMDGVLEVQADKPVQERN
ncbi:MAG: DUF6438 domain-containing protein [Saprospiraceae bacterium]|nr:DUF6438 domain-containing protein [Saprospiraceae bacterium]